ncbi:ArsR/SmtB family transcription factor [Paenibacillus alkalitolerans]|uniref:ArsR/SmtB family transcription factor n=1 Tax=Paenibacillus alkalitolerans TaxID=2799335 RepID=UPI0018F3CD9C|nr:helix-turn-helix domain-containing protein [Paenibacillus alkalitolerans]
MQLSTDSDSLLVFEALASEVRLRIIDLLHHGEKSIKALAEALSLSSAIVSVHVGKLQKAGIISCRNKRIRGGTYKFCSLATHHLQINLSPDSNRSSRKLVEISIPVGHYTDVQAIPTCGLASVEKLIGQYDDPRFFMDPERVQAGILWFYKGYVEYKVPNYLFRNQRLNEVEISMEIGSEAPKIHEQWPSDIRFYMNSTYLGKWTSPGDFGRRKGRLTPEWWSPDVNQYGLLKVLRLNANGTFIDGQRISDLKIHDLDWNADSWTFRLTAEDTGRGRGGLTLFGRGFGNYDQDLLFRVYYDSH